MAFGINPQYSREIPLGSFTKEEFLVFGVESAVKNGWDISSVSDKGFIAYTKMSFSSWSEEIKWKIEQDKGIVKSECTGSQLADWGKNKKNVECFVASLNELKTVFSPEELLLKYKDLEKTFMKGEDQTLNFSRAGTREKVRNVLGIFRPTESYFITPILIILNILLFTIMCLTGANILLPDNETLLTWGANFRPTTLEGQWWRLLTSCFLHIGIIHLLLNMYALLYIGLLLEPLLGKAKFLLAYLLTGIAASATSLWWHDFTISAGASGAIFGLYGVFLAMLTTNLIDKTARNSMLSSILIFVGYNLLFGLKGNIDNSAHTGGLVSGLFVGYCYYFVLKDPSLIVLRNSVMTSFSIVLLLYASIIYVSTDNDIGVFTKNMEEFVKKENSALEIYNLPENTDKKILLKKIKNGIRLWYDNLALTKKSSALHLPPYYRERNALLIDYCYSRINAFQYTYRAIEENTEKYQEIIERYNNKVLHIIEKLESTNH